ncbi:MAG: amidohydrolase family protein [Nevskia sp.]|nr:amidohydrolase family protein [Nevskia sp.]
MASSQPYELIVKNGRYFDGTGGPSAVRHLGIRGGKVVAVSNTALDESGCREVLDAAGKWVMPGFLDTHTHYDAELLASPGLKESVRHGVTTVTFGSCSIGMVCSEAEDCSDMFTRVESIPREHVLPLLRKAKRWDTPAGYVAHLESMPLGPNATAFLGHSDLRVSVMGLGRAVDRDQRPTEPELQRMEQVLEDGLDAGLLGLSTMTTKWDKLDGDRYRSASLPTTYARWSEYARLNKILRRRGKIHQGAPNIVTKVNTFLFLGASLGIFRKKLKTTLITLMDVKSDGLMHRVVGKLAHFCNRFLNADFRWQALPCPFEVYADGIDLVIFEEFGAGQAALHLQNEMERNRLMQDESYRRWFRRNYENRFGPRVWHRDFHDARIAACPDASLVGKSFGQVADERGIHPVDAFLDLVVEHGRKLRWHTTIGNYRPHRLKKIVQDKGAILSFSDAGAHIRNMAFYNFPLRMLKLVHDAEREGRPFMPLEKAVWRLTGELADWFDVDAGRLRLGDRADLVIVDPRGLDDALGAYAEAPIAEFDGLMRMVNRNDAAVSATVINGRIAWRDGAFAPDYGLVRGYGRFLRAGEHPAREVLETALEKAA